MLRGGETLAIGWLVIIVPVLWVAYYQFVKKDDQKERSEGMYTDSGKRRMNNIILAVFLCFAAAMIIYVAFSTRL